MRRSQPAGSGPTAANVEDSPPKRQSSGQLSSRGWLGLGLVVVFWALNWGLSGLRTQWGFFPLWLGYCLFVDALVCKRKGSSLIGRSRRAYVGLFLISAPAWWLFEALNLRVANWTYDGGQYFTAWRYFLLATFSFSTVMPAIFGTAELVGTASWMARFRSGPRLRSTGKTPALVFASGWLMLASLLLWPKYFFPFTWLSLYFILAPINLWLGHGSLGESLNRGDWRPVLALWVAGLICGFFWEMWNYYSYPKWVYHIPYVDFLHVFEMPILGYGGYLPFSLELYALYHLVVGLLGRRGRGEYLAFSLGG
jgi:hypothetical protein